MSSIIIAIDGPAASGKGTLARRLATEFGLAHLDTGGIYRAVAYLVIQKGPKDEAGRMAYAEREVASLATEITSELLASDLIRTEDVSRFTSPVSAIPEVREALKQWQISFAHYPPRLPGGKAARGAVLDGRDIGTVICPDAPAKVFVTASVDIRAQRRANELRSRGENVNDATVLAALKERDARDISRATAPTIAAPDALVLDTSALDRDAAYAALRSFVLDKIPALKNVA